MKKISLVIFLSVTLAPAIVLGVKTLKGAVYSPEQGIICDKKAGFCADLIIWVFPWDSPRNF